VARLDAAGQLLWSKLITSSDPLDEWTTNVAIAADGGILLTDENKQFMVKVDINGNSCPYCPSADFGTYTSVNATIQADQAASAYGPWATPATLTFTANDVTASASYSICGTTGVDELSVGRTVLVSPNPFSDRTVITVEPPVLDPIARIEVVDALGRNVMVLPVRGSSVVIEKGSMVPGSYGYRIIGSDGVVASGVLQVGSER
jgi:hypothetical protein